MNDTAGYEEFYGVFVGHFNFMNVLLGDKKEKSGDGMGGCGHKYGDEGGVDFLLALFGDFAGLEAESFGGREGKGENNGIFKGFFPFAGEERGKNIAADFVNGFDKGDSGEE